LTAGLQHARSLLSGTLWTVGGQHSAGLLLSKHAEHVQYRVYTIEQTSSKHQAGLMKLRPWLKCRPRLSPQLITCYIGLPITTRPLS